MRHQRDRGDSFVEVVIAVVLVGLTVSALIAGLGTAGSSAQFHRVRVEADTLMRNYAEATKAAARRCTGTGDTYEPWVSLPRGFTVSATPAGNRCPPPGTSQPLTLEVTGPDGVGATMQIVVRTP